MKNQTVIENFLNGQSGKTEHLYTAGNKLINYTTVIAKIENGVLFMSNRKYSVTTSKIQNKVRSLSRYQIQEVDHAILN